ncbi:MAG: hypothetical protein P0121_15225, partial [Nitrospira sp.]|nr:hypothetical protein [Nitrospira sp.]
MISGAYDPRRYPGEDVTLTRPHHAVALRAEAPATLRKYVLAGIVRQDEVETDDRVTRPTFRADSPYIVVIEE